MPDRRGVHAELEEQRCLIEEQQVEIQRQRRRLQLQVNVTALIQTELDAIKATLQHAASTQIKVTS